MVARFTRGDLGLAWARVAGGGAGPPGWRTPLKVLCGLVGCPTAWGGVVPGESMVLFPLGTHGPCGGALTGTT